MSLHDAIRPYAALFRARARTLFSYRLAAVAGLMTQWAFGFILISVLYAFYESADAAQPMTFAQTVTYTWVGQAMLGMLPWNIDRDTGESIRTGAVAYDLARPLDMYAYWYVRAFAMRTAPTLLKAVPMFVIATFLMPKGLAMAWPGPTAMAAWLISVLGAVLLSAAITVLMQTTMFYTVTGDGVTRILPNVVIVLSGLVIPLPLFPDWMQTVLRYQPFSGVFSDPSLLFCGTLPAREIFRVFPLQLFWTAGFILIGRAILLRGLRKLTVAGG